MKCLCWSMKLENHVIGSWFFILPTKRCIYCLKSVVDSPSVDLILNDLFKAYQGKLSSPSGPSYSAYIAYLQDSETENDLAYWKQKLENTKSCEFPALSEKLTEQPEDNISSVNTELDDFQAPAEFASTHGITPANVLQLAWTVVLSMYSGSD